MKRKIFVLQEGNICNILKMEGEGHIFDWIGKIDPNLFRKKYQDKSERKDSLKRMGLPTYNEIVVNLEEFDSDPEKYLSQVVDQNQPVDNFYFTIFPVAEEKGGLSTGKQGFSKEQMLNFLRNQKIDIAKHTIIVEPHHEKVYSGTINISDGGRISGEFVTGQEQSALSRGESIPEFIIQGQLVDIDKEENFSYHSKDESENEREIFLKAIRMAGQAVRRKYRGNLPTNLDLDLELFYISPGEGQEPHPIFFDILDHTKAKAEIAGKSRFNVSNWRNRTSE
jgi:hypothetical protein